MFFYQQHYGIFLMTFLYVFPTAILGFGSAVGAPWCTLLTRRLTSLNSKLFGPEEFDDGIGNANLGPEEFDDGIGNANFGRENEQESALEKDFFNELRNREKGTNNALKSAQPEKVAGDQIIETSSSVRSTTDTSPTPKKKFTGQQESFYARSGGPTSMSSSSSNIRGRTPREMMMEREYQLVSRAERGIGIQAVFAALLLIFYIYVGMSGGIVSGDEALLDFGADDNIPFEQLMPVQSDREVSVWL